MNPLVLVLIAVIAWEAWMILNFRRKNRDLQAALDKYSEGLQSKDEFTGCVSDGLPASLSVTEKELPASLSEEEDTRQATILYKIQVLCQFAEVHLENLSDEYESQTLRKRIEEAKVMTTEIDNEFYKSAAFQFIISLAHRANWREDVTSLLPSVTNSIIREIVMQELGDTYT